MAIYCYLITLAYTKPDSRVSIGISQDVSSTAAKRSKFSADFCSKQVLSIPTEIRMRTSLCSRIILNNLQTCRNRLKNVKKNNIKFLSVDHAMIIRDSSRSAFEILTKIWLLVFLEEKEKEECYCNRTKEWNVRCQKIRPVLLKLPKGWTKSGPLNFLSYSSHGFYKTDTASSKYSLILSMRTSSNRKLSVQTHSYKNNKCKWDRNHQISPSGYSKFP